MSHKKAFFDRKAIDALVENGFTTFGDLKIRLAMLDMDLHHFHCIQMIELVTKAVIMHDPNTQILLVGERLVFCLEHIRHLDLRGFDRGRWSDEDEVRWDILRDEIGGYYSIAVYENHLR